MTYDPLVTNKVFSCALTLDLSRNCYEVVSSSDSAKTGIWKLVTTGSTGYSVVKHCLGFSDPGVKRTIIHEIRIQRMTQNEGLLGFGWTTLWRLIGSIFIPVTFVPWLLYLFLGQGKEKKLLLKDKVVLITGASSGLGEALAHAFYSAGCKIILAARREKELERVKESLMIAHATRTTHPPVVLPLDLSDINSIPQYVSKALAIHGCIDILVNNAGMSHRGTVLNTNIDVDIKLMLVNYFGQVAMTKAILPSMVERSSGHIVAISSVQGLIAIPFRSAYAASKHALQAFSDTLRAEVASNNVKVTVVSAGYIRTSLSLNALTGDGKTYGKMDAATESGYSPEYVAAQVVQAVVERKEEVVVAPLAPRAAILARSLIPKLYFWIMQSRAQKEKSKS